jgi:hypothetical protein
VTALAMVGVCSPAVGTVGWGLGFAGAMDEVRVVWRKRGGGRVLLGSVWSVVVGVGVGLSYGAALGGSRAWVQVSLVGK